MTCGLITNKYKEYIRKKRKKGHNSGKNQKFKKQKQLSPDNCKQSTMSKFQVPSLNGVGCGDDTHTYIHTNKHTYIHTHIVTV